jgi:general secretion pathway protein I
MRDRTYAHWVAMNTLTELRLRDQRPEEEELDDDVEFAGRNWVWRAEISETEVENLYRVEIKVAFEEEPDLILRTLTGFIGPPVAPSAPGRVWAQDYIDENNSL